MKKTIEPNPLEEKDEALIKALEELTESELALVFGGKFLPNGPRTCKGQATSNVLYTEQLESNTVANSVFNDLKDRNGKSLDIEETDTITVS